MTTSTKSAPAAACCDVLPGEHLTAFATEALQRIASLYAIEKDIRALSAEERCAIHQERSRHPSRSSLGCAPSSL